MAVRLLGFVRNAFNTTYGGIYRVRDSNSTDVAIQCAHTHTHRRQYKTTGDRSEKKKSSSYNIHSPPNPANQQLCLSHCTHHLFSNTHAIYEQYAVFNVSPSLFTDVLFRTSIVHKCCSFFSFSYFPRIVLPTPTRIICSFNNTRSYYTLQKCRCAFGEYSRDIIQFESTGRENGETLFSAPERRKNPRAYEPRTVYRESVYGLTILIRYTKCVLVLSARRNFVYFISFYYYYYNVITEKNSIGFVNIYK